MLTTIKKFVATHKRLVVILSVILLIIFLVIKTRNTSPTPTYQTAVVSRGTLINSVTASGTILATNNIDVTSSANGQISKIYVKEGDTVAKGKKLFDITLDATGQQKQSQAYATYLSAKNSLNSAQASYYTLQAAAFSANQKFINNSVSRNLATTDPTYIQENDAWLAAEKNFNNAQNSISAAQANLANASIAYQQASSTVVAPVAGTIQNITLVPGMALTTSTTTSSSESTAGTTLASIQTPGNPVATVNISEADITKIKAGQKVTLTLDSLANTTFTGIVAGINKLGVSSSGVTSYPATITFDSSSNAILPKMSISASIITNIKNDVLLVPSLAVQTQDGQSTVRKLQDGHITTIPVTIGETSDTQTEILSGIDEGDTIVTSIIAPITTNSSNTTSPFSGLNRGGAGGNTVRFNTGAGRGN